MQNVVSYNFHTNVHNDRKICASTSVKQMRQQFIKGMQTKKIQLSDCIIFRKVLTENLRLKPLSKCREVDESA